MLTDDTRQVDAAAADGGPLMVSVSALAKLKGVSKQAIAKRLARLEAEGLIAAVRRGPEKLVSLAEWDTVTGETTDPAKLAARDTGRVIRGEGRGALDAHADANLAGGKPPADPSYTYELTRKARYEADRREIELARLRGELVEVVEVERAAASAAELIVRELEQFVAAADELAGAVSHGGVAELRRVLKGRVTGVRASIAKAMGQLALPGAATGDEDQEEAA